MFKFHTEGMLEKIHLLDKMNEIKSTDLNYDFFVSRLYEMIKLEVSQTRTLKVLEPNAGQKMDVNRPLMVWKSLTKYFGQDYFLEAIEKEYGISPEGNRILMAQMKDMYLLSVD